MPIYVMTVNNPDHRLSEPVAPVQENDCEDHGCHCSVAFGVTSAVVRATSEEEARQVMYDDYATYLVKPENEGAISEADRDAWLSPEKTSAFRVTEEGETGIVYDAWLYW